MDKKKILIIVGVVAVVGVGLYMWNKSKKDTQGSEEGGSEAPADATVTKSAEATPESTESVKAPLVSKKDRRKACGIEPKKITGILTGGVAMINFKKRKAKWQQCVDAGGKASFEGDFDDFQNDYIDFEGQVDNQFMYSEFENSLNLDL